MGGVSPRIDQPTLCHGLPTRQEGLLCVIATPWFAGSIPAAIAYGGSKKDGRPSTMAPTIAHTSEASQEGHLGARTKTC
jgi:hypothetical protein